MGDSNKPDNDLLDNNSEKLPNGGRTCGRCHWYQRTTNVQDLSAKQGTCHLGPPTVTSISFPQQGVQGIQIQVQTLSQFPTVQATQYCGQFEPSLTANC